VALAADGQWNSFNVSDIDSQTFGVEWIDNNDSLSPDFGSRLEFSFTIGAGFTGKLSVVDAGFAGDTFSVTNFGLALGSTSNVPAQTVDSAVDIGVDFDAALAHPSFSQGVFTLAAGDYRISGMLAQSVSFDGVALNSTIGGLNLLVTAVPEASTWGLMGAGLGLLAFVSRRRRL